MIYRDLLYRSLVAVLICAMLVALCFYFVDRPVAFFVKDHKINSIEIFNWITFVPVWCETAAPILLILAAFRVAWRPLSRFELFLVAASANLLITLPIKDLLKTIFGRDWPDTWIHNNPSLLRDDAYGFYFFHGSEVYGSFPSGHTARIVAVMSVLWIAYPRWRWLAVGASVAVMVSLVAMNYHFVGDTIAGACVGGITGMYAAQLAGLRQRKSSP